MQIFACTKRQNEKNDAPKRKSKTKPRKKIRNKNPKQIKHCNELKKPRDQQVAGLFLLIYFIAFPSVWREGKNVEINTLGS
ncbi:MAG: hypothetical protein EGR33_08205 [Prevotella sp.]|nr:hypothetical protein [Prevotella sp.]